MTATQMPSSSATSVNAPSSTKLMFTAVAESCRWLFPVILKNGLSGFIWLISLHGLEAAANQGFGLITGALQRSGREDISIIALLAITELVFSLLQSAAWMIVILEIADAVVHGRRAHPASRLALCFNHVLIEQVRSVASVLWRSPLLVVPAMIRYVRLSLVPLVVILAPEYSEGRQDALRASSSLSRGRFWLLLAVLVVTFGLPALLEHVILGEGSQWVWENPLGVGLSWSLTFIADVLTSLFLFFVFRGITLPSLQSQGVQV